MYCVDIMTRCQLSYCQLSVVCQFVSFVCVVAPCRLQLRCSSKYSVLMKRIVDFDRNAILYRWRYHKRGKQEQKKPSKKDSQWFPSILGCGLRSLTQIDTQKSTIEEIRPQTRGYRAPFWSGVLLHTGQTDGFQTSRNGPALSQSRVEYL